MRVCLIALAVSTAPALAACATEPVTTTTAVQRDLTVTGPREGLERFVALQGSRNPPVVTSAVTPLDDGRATAVVTLPASYDGREIVQTTREALAAGLSYEYADASPNKIRRR